MMITRRHAMRGLAASGVVPVRALAQPPWPAHAIRFVVPFPAGGGADMLARRIGQAVSANIGQAMVIENRDGAGGAIGAANLARSQADGYNILMGASSIMAVHPNLLKLPYDTLSVFAAVTLLATSPLILAVNADLPVRTVQELIDYAKKNPGKLSCGSAGYGSVGHLTSAMFNRAAGIDIVHVPFRGSAPSVTALMAGTTQIVFETPLTIIPAAKTGRVVLLATTGEKRAASFPNLPTVAEAAGLPNFHSSLWYAIFVPAATPREIVAQVNAAFVHGLNDPAIRDAMTQESLEPVGDTPDECERFWKSEFARWGDLIRAENIKID
jgi:tripartite-type tricarboxylate transporter receptor subunit TctC